MKYVALLRGINVGGNNKVSMADLKLALEQDGFKNVSTYINSGNVLFDSTSSSKSALGEKVEKVIEGKFGFPVSVVIMSAKDILAIEKALPEELVNDETAKCDIIFLRDDIDNADVKTKVIIKAGIDNVIYVPGALIWSIDRKDAGKSGLMKLIGTDLYKKMTIRNCNTLRKLATLMTE